MSDQLSLFGDGEMLELLDKVEVPQHKPIKISCELFIAADDADIHRVVTDIETYGKSSLMYSFMIEGVLQFDESGNELPTPILYDQFHDPAKVKRETVEGYNEIANRVLKKRFDTRLIMADIKSVHDWQSYILRRHERNGFNNK